MMMMMMMMIVILIHPWFPSTGFGSYLSVDRLSRSLSAGGRLSG
jgi:hypothetical protein